MARYKLLSAYLEDNANRLADKLALVVGEDSLSWSQLWQEVEATSQALAPRLNNQNQQVVSLVIPNTREFVVAYLAILHCGHIASPIDVIYKSLEIEAILHQINPNLVITDSQNKSRFKTDLPVLTLSDLKPPKDKEQFKPLRLPSDEQIATLLFTSGTTGKPKTVPYTHTNQVWNIDVCSRVWNWDERDSLLISLRLSHMHGIVMGLTGSLYHGGTMYLQDRFDAEGTLRILASGKVSMFTHGPLVYAKLLEAPNPEKYDLSGVRLFISGSGPLPPAVWQQFKDVFGAEILEVYGSTETGRIASNLLEERIPGSPGRLLPEVEIKLSPEGEVMIKSPGVIAGYWHNEQLTKESCDADGYWRVGDLGELKDGRLILKGRLHERIRRQGYTVSPRDVEWALLTNPEIKEVSVIGAQNPGESDNQLVYFVRTGLTDEQIKDFCKQALPSIWRPNKIIHLSSIPQTRNGKANIPALRAML